MNNFSAHTSCRNTLLVLTCGWLAILAAAATARGQCPSGPVFAPDGAENDVFGFCVSISGDTMIVPSPQDDTPNGIDAGSAHIFVRSGNAWTHQAQLFAPDGATEDYFGVAVAISGDTVVVGSPRDDTQGGSNTGSAYVFVRDGTSWTFQAHLVASDAAPTDRLGRAVAIDGDTIVVGAWADDTLNGGFDAGSAYVFVRNGTTWTQEAQLFASDGAPNDYFSSYAVAVSGDTIVVGAADDDTSAGIDAGSVYVFDRSGTIWTQTAHLFASDAQALDYFGMPVDISGDSIIVGALSDDTPGGIDAGSAYVFVRGEGGWTEQAHLFAPDPASDDYFGWCAIDGDTAVVSAYADDTSAGTDVGSADVFVRSEEGIWAAKMPLTAPGASAFDNFGYFLDISGSAAVVTAPFDDTSAGIDAGSAYVFNLGCTPGDMNCDNAVDLADVPHFIQALLATGNFAGCDISRADINADVTIDGRDVQAFVAAVTVP